MSNPAAPRRRRGAHLAVWAAPAGAVIGVVAAIVADVNRVSVAVPEVATGLVLAIVFSSGSWGPGLFLAGAASDEATPTRLTRIVSVYINVPLLMLWAISPVLALAAEGCGGPVVVAVLFASLGSASCYALMAGLAEGIRTRLEEGH